jgi:hypothetical protein
LPLMISVSRFAGMHVSSDTGVFQHLSLHSVAKIRETQLEYVLEPEIRFRDSPDEEHRSCELLLKIREGKLEQIGSGSGQS